MILQSILRIVVGFLLAHVTHDCSNGASVNVQQQHEVDRLVSLVEALQGIDAGSPLANLNETTISDNNGGRIEL